MSLTIQHKRGTEANKPILATGEYYFATDTEKVFIGTASGDRQVNLLELLTDVSITTTGGPNDNDLLQYNSSTEKWENTALIDNVYAETINGGTGSQWILTQTGSNLYYYDVVHNLGSKDVVVSVRDANTDLEIQVEEIDRTDTNTVRITLEGNELDVRVVVISGNLSAGGGGGGASGVTTSRGVIRDGSTGNGSDNGNFTSVQDWQGSGPYTSQINHGFSLTNGDELTMSFWRNNKKVEPVDVEVTSASIITITSNTTDDMVVVFQG